MKMITYSRFSFQFWTFSRQIRYGILIRGKFFEQTMNYFVKDVGQEEKVFSAEFRTRFLIWKGLLKATKILLRIMWFRYFHLFAAHICFHFPTGKKSFMPYSYRVLLQITPRLPYILCECIIWIHKSGSANRAHLNITKWKGRKHFGFYRTFAAVKVEWNWANFNCVGFTGDDKRWLEPLPREGREKGGGGKKGRGEEGRRRGESRKGGREKGDRRGTEGGKGGRQWMREGRPRYKTSTLEVKIRNMQMDRARVDLFPRLFAEVFCRTERLEVHRL